MTAKIVLYNGDYALECDEDVAVFMEDVPEDWRKAIIFPLKKKKKKKKQTRSECR